VSVACCESHSNESRGQLVSARAVGYVGHGENGETEQAAPQLPYQQALDFSRGVSV